MTIQKNFGKTHINPKLTNKMCGHDNFKCVEKNVRVLSLP